MVTVQIEWYSSLCETETVQFQPAGFQRLSDAPDDATIDTDTDADDLHQPQFVRFDDAPFRRQLLPASGPARMSSVLTGTGRPGVSDTGTQMVVVAEPVRLQFHGRQPERFRRRGDGRHRRRRRLGQGDRSEFEDRSESTTVEQHRRGQIDAHVRARHQFRQ